MDNLNLIRSIAHKFHQKTGLEYEELFQEAALRYCLAKQDWDDEKAEDNKFSSFAYQRMYFRLVNYCKEQEKQENHFIPYGEFPPPIEPAGNISPDYDFEIATENWPKECKEMARVVLNDPVKYEGETANFARNGTTPKQRVKNEFRRRGWTHKRINWTFNKLKTLI